LSCCGEEFSQVARILAGALMLKQKKAIPKIPMNSGTSATKKRPLPGKGSAANVVREDGRGAGKHQLATCLAQPPKPISCPATALSTGSGSGEMSHAAKRKKASDIPADEALKKVHEALTAGLLSKLSVPELKAYLKAKGKPVGGKKADLLARIENKVD
jgi:hypothetical protein